jgi:hypothetical protein
MIALKTENMILNPQYPWLPCIEPTPKGCKSLWVKRLFFMLFKEPMFIIIYGPYLLLRK